MMKRVNTSFLLMLLLLTFFATSYSEEVLMKAIFVNGKVQSKETQKSAWKPVRIGKELGRGDQVKTDVESEIKMQLPDGGLVEVQEKSILEITEMVKAGTVVKSELALLGGHMLFKLKSPEGEKRQFKFNTITATAAIRGTTCDLAASSQRTGMACEEGLAQLNSKIQSDFNYEVCAGCVAIQLLNGRFLVREFSDPNEYQKALTQMLEWVQDTTMNDSLDRFIQKEFVGDSLLLWQLPGNSGMSSYLWKLPKSEWQWVNTPEQYHMDDEVYLFSNWEVASGEKVEIETGNLNSTRVRLNLDNGEIKPVYKRVEYPLDIKVEGQGNTLPSGQVIVPAGVDYEIQATGAQGYHFTEWVILEGEGTLEKFYHAQTQIKMYSPIKLQAVFSKTSRQLLIEDPMQGGRSKIQGDLRIEPGRSLTLEAESDERYYFDQWVVVSGKAKINDPFSPVTEVILDADDAVIKPSFKPLSQVKIEQSTGKGILSTNDAVQWWWTRPDSLITLKTPPEITVLEKSFEFYHWELVEGAATIENPELPEIRLLAPENIVVKALYRPILKSGSVDFYNSDGQKKVLRVEYR